MKQERAQPQPEAAVDVAIDDPAWQASLPDPAASCTAAAAAVFERVGSGGSICILLADDETVRDLNRRFRGIDRATNVLSFPMTGALRAPGQTMPLGDVALARETVLREAAEQGKPPLAHAVHLVVHGVLHLLGYDHGTDADAAAMENLEREILAGLGWPDPYAAPDEQDRAAR